MALNGNRILYTTTSTRTPFNQIPPLPGPASFSSPASWAQSTPRHQLLIVSAASKKVSSSPSSSSRLGKFDSKNKRSLVSTKEEKEEEISGENGGFQGTDELIDAGGGNGVKGAVDYDDGYEVPKLPGEEPDFWEGPQWDGLGFFMQYMWAFGILFAIVSSLIAVATYNEGATDFKDTPAYKESIQSQELLDEPDASSSDIFESNPTEAAPSLE